jgi:PhnB protein
MPINPYLTFDGNAREAATYYAQIFETEPPQFMTYGDQPADPNYPLPEAARDRIMHTRIMIDGTPLMFSDNFPGMDFGAPFTVGNNITLTVTGKDRAKMQRQFDALAKEGTVIMPVQETSWSKMYGLLRDKFGIEWQFNLDEGVA